MSHDVQPIQTAGPRWDGEPFDEPIAGAKSGPAKV